MPVTVQPPIRLRASRPPVRWGTLGFALGAGLAAALLAFLLVRGRVAAGTSSPETVQVVMALHTIPARTRLTAALLQVRPVPAAQVPEGAFSHPSSILGKITVQTVASGMAITRDALAALGGASGLAFVLPPLQRAVTVATDPADGVDQFARPGDHVDILESDVSGGSSAETRTVLQNVALLAVGAQTSANENSVPPVSSPGSASLVTVAVSPAQAQALVRAAVRGKIHLALRPADDDGIVALPPLAPLPVPIAKPAHRLLPLPGGHSHHMEIAAMDAEAPIPLSPLPVIAMPMHTAQVTVTVIKGSQSQTVSVVP